MRFTLTIDTDNAAFQDGAFGDELATVLGVVAGHVRGLTGHATGRAVYDSNGNRVGMWRLAESPRWTVSDRRLHRDGVPVLALSRVGSDADGYTIRPHETDELAALIVDALNRA